MGSKELRQAVRQIQGEVGEADFNLLYCLLRDSKNEFVTILRRRIAIGNATWNDEYLDRAEDVLEKIVQAMTEIE